LNFGHCFFQNLFSGFHLSMDSFDIFSDFIVRALEFSAQQVRADFDVPQWCTEIVNHITEEMSLFVSVCVHLRGSGVKEV